ncbi:type II toxin-antitoxin system PemK/MazF family toxin [Oceaniglobus trochenteri]|uniref:type II toxin-antitoxin system PemK/MazF family toxin n=1 Tax=Oceaniglobus trochenteri TaxID=2763260 RepID=UPI001CFFF781|nr:type II toxin-antitoxin system PemK/MazF family toxin [Oceaniglobus trochenteri]
MDTQVNLRQPHEGSYLAIGFHPRAGQILVCDFEGFVEPEMVKVRPVMVISPRLPYRSFIVTIVPISLTAPTHCEPYVVQLSKNYHPKECDTLPCWAKCDMVMNVARSRLDGFKVDRRKYLTPTADAEDLRRVKLGVIHGLGMQSLLK